jgi:VanZ family protein
VILLRNPWFPPLVWAIFTLILCGWPGNQLPEIIFWKWLRWDKITHLFLFGIQSYLLLVAALKTNRYGIVTPKTGWLIAVCTISFGALVEILQFYVFIGRSGDIKDAIANAIGAMLGIWIFRKYRQSNA